MSGEKRIECPKCGNLFVRGRVLEEQTFGCGFCEILAYSAPTDVIEAIPRAVPNKNIEVKPVSDRCSMYPRKLYCVRVADDETNKSDKENVEDGIL